MKINYNEESHRSHFMHLLFATGIYPPDIGGPATYAVLMERELRERGWVVTLRSFGGVRHLPPLIRHGKFAWRLWRDSFGAQALFAQDTVSVGLPALLVAKLRRIPLVIRVPGDFAWEQGVQRFGVKEDIDTFQSRRYGWRVEFLRWIQRCVVRGADRVLAPSQYFADLVRGWVRSPEKVLCMYNGVAVPKAISPHEYPGPTLITAARLVPWKGIDTLIEALCEVPSARLVVVGEGPDRARLEERSELVGVQDRVEFTGALPREELLSRIAGAEMFLLGSSFESFSFQLVEAMMMGAPVIARDIGNLRELIEPELNGVLLREGTASDYASAIRRLLEDPQRRLQMGVAARESAQHFSVQATGAALDHLLRSLVS